MGVLFQNARIALEADMLMFSEKARLLIIASIA